MNGLCITDAVKKFGLTSKTLRYYENVGLLGSKRSENNNYRYYDELEVERIKQIIILRKMQISIKDIIHIYESEDMSTVVEVFINRINAIDEKVGALSELKRITNEFLHTMLKRGVTKISALPLLYDEMDKQLEMLEKSKPVTYEELSAISEKINKDINLSIVDMPSIRMLSSIRKDNGISDINGFTNWIMMNNFPRYLPGSQGLFEYQDNKNDTIFLRKIDGDFENDSPYADIFFDGGLFATGSIFIDEEIGAFHREMTKYFDNNRIYQVDYQHDGSLRHETFLENVLSPDEKREKVNIYLAVKKRLPDASLYDQNEQIDNISIEEVETANPILWTKEFPIDGELEHIQPPQKEIKTGIKVQYPLRVDIDFRIGKEIIPQYSGAGRGIPPVIIKFGDEVYGINMNNNADKLLSQESILFNQPIIKNKFNYPKLGRIEIPEKNHLTWIIGAKHFAVIINNEVRYCGINFPYMGMDLLQTASKEIRIETSQGINKVYFRKIKISQLRIPCKINTKKGAIKMYTRQSNNILSDIRNIIDGEGGVNYPFDDCMAFLMERLGRPELNYPVFAGITGDSVTPIYNKNNTIYRDNASQYNMGPDYIKYVFDAVGYEHTYVSAGQINANKMMYIQTLMSYIDRGIPVIAVEDASQGIKAGSEEVNHFLIVGYEDYGKIILVHLGNKNDIKKFNTTEIINQDWIFAGDKIQDIVLNEINRNSVLKMAHWLTLPEKDGVYFGAAAFRAWADDIEGGRYDDNFSLWGNYTCYICNLSSNAANAGDEPTFVKRCAEAYPEYMEMYKKINQQYKKMSNGPGQTWKELEDLGGGFNVKYEALRDTENRIKIATELRKAGDILDEVVQVLKKYLSED